jgi:PIN domain nuclease of toxin-antitoxin system
VSFLLDTHVFLWFEAGSDRLPQRVRAVIENHEQPVYVSAISFWEIATKRRTGKLRYEGSARAAAGAAGFAELVVDGADAERAGDLDWDHRDPFDRMLVAQGLNRLLTVVTADAAMRGYRGLPTLWAG